MEQLGSEWTDFNETWHFRFFKKCVEKIQVSSQSDKNNKYFTWRRFHIYMSCWILLRMRNLLDKSCRDNQNTFYGQWFFLKMVLFMRQSQKMWWSQTGLKWQYGSMSHAGLVRLHARTHACACALLPTLMPPPARTHARTHPHTHTNICMWCYFPMATMVSWTRLNVMLQVHCLSCYYKLKLNFGLYIQC
jgi:hypothetical protein